jgi:lysozyme family protein
MAAGNFDRCVTVVLKEEGGFVDNPRDPGGATNMGITLHTLQEARGQPVTVEDLQNLSVAEAESIYRRFYWNAVAGDQLPAGVDMTVFDFAVNGGPGEAVRLLQQCVGCAVDGVMGPATLAAVQAADAKALIEKYSAARDSYYETLPTFSTFGRGWEARVATVEQTSLTMVA